MKKLMALLLITSSLAYVPARAMDAANDNAPAAQAVPAKEEEKLDPATKLKNELLRKYPALGKVLVATAFVGAGYGAYQTAGAFVGTDLYKFLLVNSPTLRWVNLELWNIIHDNCYSLADWLYLQRIIFS